MVLFLFPKKDSGRLRNTENYLDTFISNLESCRNEYSCAHVRLWQQHNNDALCDSNVS